MVTIENNKITNRLNNKSPAESAGLLLFNSLIEIESAVRI